MTVYNVLYILLVFSFALSAGAMWINWRLNPHELAVRDWAISLSLILVGCGLAVVARLQLPTAESMIPLTPYSFLRDLGTAINGLAWIVIWVGMLRFMGRSIPRKRTLFLVWAMFFSLLLAAHPLGISGAWGVAWISLLVACCSLLVIYEILRPRVGGVASWFAFAGFSLAAVTWGVRAIMSFMDLQRPIDSDFDIGVLFGAVISAYACMMGMILLTNQRLIDRIGNLSDRDSLTSVLNRGAFFEAVPPLLDRARMSKQVCTLVLVDVDNFKEINEGHGYQSGDDSLRQIAIASMQVLGRQDLFARYGSDEFIFFFYGKSALQSKALMNRLQILMQQNIIESQKGAFRIQLSMGIADGKAETVFDGLIRQAEAALNKAKLDDRTRVQIYEPKQNFDTIEMSVGTT